MGKFAFFRQPLTATAANIETKSRLSKIIVGISLFLIVYFTLFPFDFFFKKVPPLLEILQNFDLSLTESYALADFPRNIVLFTPFGFGLAGWLLSENIRRVRIYPLSLLLGIGLSFTVEVLQTYALLRFPSFGDVLANSLGTAVGILIYHFYSNKILSVIARLINLTKSFFTFRRMLIAYLFYLFMWLSISYLMQNEARLSNWDDQYLLLLGNERTQDRPWQGIIQQLHIGDRALSEEEVARLFQSDSSIFRGDNSIVAFYDFKDDTAGNFPVLDWKSTGPIQTDSAGAALSKDQWLQTDQPVTLLTQALTNSSQFTVGITAASRDQTQTGPARLVSISKDPFLRNLTIGQQETSLVFRLRTPLTGLDGSQPELIIPEVFADQLFHQIIITYDGAVVRLYVDNPANIYTIELVPTIAIFTTFFPNDVPQMRINRGNMFIFRFLYSTIIFLPLSALVHFWRKTQPTMGKIKFVWLGGGFITLATSWELLLNSIISGYDLRVGTIMLNLVVMVVALFLFTIQSRKSYGS